MARILTGDEEPTVRRSISQILRRHGHEVHQAAHGATALRMASTRNFDVVLVDYQLQGQDGLEVLQRIRELQPGCLRILVTRVLDLSLAIEAVNCGEVSRVLRKPFRNEQLVRAITDALKTQQRLSEVVRVQQEAVQNEEQLMLEECFNSEHLSLALQPVARGVSGEVVAFEALLRCEHPVLNGPLPVIRTAERNGRLGELTDVVFKRAAQWLRRLPSSISLFINLHPEDLSNTEAMIARLKFLQPWASRVVLEVTERSRLQSIDCWEDSVCAAKQRGFAIAVDDLGSGYNSLGMLADLQPRYIKIDMSIIRGVDREPRKQRLVEMLSRFATTTGSELVAEGVETETEARALRQNGVHLLQGYYFGRPSQDDSEIQTMMKKKLWSEPTLQVLHPTPDSNSA